MVVLYCESPRRKHFLSVAVNLRDFKETFDRGGSASGGGTASSRRLANRSSWHHLPPQTADTLPANTESLTSIPGTSGARLFLLSCSRTSWRWTKVIWNLCSSPRSSTSSGGSTRDGLWAGCRRTGGCREDSRNQQNKESHWPARRHLVLTPYGTRSCLWCHLKKERFIIYYFIYTYLIQDRF